MKTYHVTLILKLTNLLALNLILNTAHWRDEKLGKLHHGPQTWPWWRLFSLSLVTLHLFAPTTGKRLWLYTRWGAIYLDIALDRRGVIKERLQWWVRSWTY